jgi:REP element-mobilizing transposase RayT
MGIEFHGEMGYLVVMLRRGESQLPLPFPRGRGGVRAGAGRPCAPGRRSTPHRARPKHRAYEPVHVTLRTSVRSLRSQFVFPTVRDAIARANQRWHGRFRIVHFSVQADHVHLIVEADDRRTLIAALRGFSVSCARHLNRLLFRTGCVFPERWHGRALTTPRAVRHALRYVLANAQKHGEAVGSIDPLSSAPYFRGFREFPARAPVEWDPGLVPRLTTGVDPPARARSWLLCAGWRRGGLLSIHDIPKS